MDSEDFGWDSHPNPTTHSTTHIWVVKNNWSFLHGTPPPKRDPFLGTRAAAAPESHPGQREPEMGDEAAGHMSLERLEPDGVIYR